MCAKFDKKELACSANSFLTHTGFQEVHEVGLHDPVFSPDFCSWDQTETDHFSYLLLAGLEQFRRLPHSQQPYYAHGSTLFCCVSYIHLGRLGLGKVV